MMEQDVALTALKAVSIVVTGILGIVGVLGKFKRKDGRPTWSGVVTVIGITFTMLTSVIVTLQEAEKEKEEAHKQLDRMEGLYQEIHRTIQPITYVNLAFFAALPMDDKNVKNYAAYLDAIISSRKSKLQHSFAPVKGLSVRVLDHNGDIIAIEIDQKSPYWPKKDNLLNRLTQTLSFEIYLRKDPIKPELLNPAIVGDYGNDLIVWATEPLAWPNNVIWVDYPSKKLSILTFPRFHRHLYKEEFDEIGGRYEHQDQTAVHRRV